MTRPNLPAERPGPGAIESALIELAVSDGIAHVLAGRMTPAEAYVWSAGVFERVVLRQQLIHLAAEVDRKIRRLGHA